MRRTAIDDKGGIGKSTATQHTATALVEGGREVMVIDCDPGVRTDGAAVGRTGDAAGHPGSRQPHPQQRIGFAVRGDWLEHFARAGVFRIVESDGAGYRVIEDRQVRPIVTRGGHDEDAFDQLLADLADCQAIVVARIGPGAATFVMRHGVRLFQAAGQVDQVAEALARAGVLDGAHR